MASRYLVASGNWNSTSVWSATSGGSSGASVPGSSDVAYLDTTNTVTLIGDVSVLSITVGGVSSGSPILNVSSHSLSVATNNPFNFYRGTLNITSGALNIRTLQVGTTGSKTMNLGNGTINFVPAGNNHPNISFDSASLTVNSSNSMINITSGTGSSNFTFNTGSKIFNDVSINLFGDNNNLIIAGSPTFNRLHIYNANGASHTVKLPASITQTVRKLVVEDVILKSSIAGTKANIAITGSNQLVAAQNIDVQDIAISGAGTYYAGSTSVDSGNNTGWVFDDAPLVETFSDGFTSGTIDTSKWTSTGSGLSQGGGQLIFSNTSGSGTRTASIISKNQWLAEGSSIRFKANISSLTGSLTVLFSDAYTQYGVSSRRNIPDIYVTLTNTTGQFFIRAATNYTSVAFDNDYTFYRIRESGGTIYLDGSTDGIAYTNVKSAVASNYGLDTTQLISRPTFKFYTESSDSIILDDFNIDLEPTAQFTSNVTSGTTPLTVNFTDQSNFTPDTWAWDFGDSTTSTDQNPTKIYSTPGTYTVELESSNSSYTRTVTKTNYITASPNVYSRSISGLLSFAGSLARKILASRSLSGTLLFGGSVRAVVLRDVEGLQDKRYLYKVYDPDGEYIEVWKDVISELNFTNEVNTIGSTTTVELARNSDSVGVTVANLNTEDDNPVLTEDDLNIQVATESRNQIGSGSSVDYNNRVDITVFYGSVEPLMTEAYEEIWTEDDEQLLADIGAPNGRRVFTGFISEINSRYGNTETTIVQLTSYGWDLDQFPITTSEGATTVPFNSYDPSDIAAEAIDKFVLDSDGYGTYTVKTDTSISDTGTVVSYTFRANTYKEVLDKVLELMPSNWYYRIGLGDNTVYFRERTTEPRHMFYLGKHIKALDLRGSILDSTNRVLFTGGGDPALFISTEEVPADRTRRKLDIISDSRVTLEDSADIISDTRIENNNKPLFRTSIEILSVQYDIESINVGDTVGFRNFGNYVDSLTMQVVGLTYSPDSVQLQLETKPPTISKRLEDIRRNLTVTENANIPSSPS